MFTIKYGKTSGQSLVFFVIISVAILGFMAVIVDGGNMYAMRRLAQNAADAGALAGARQLCLTGNTLLAKTSAESYATDNNEVRLGNVLGQTALASITGKLVDVQVAVNYGSYFARILGIDDLTAVATAQAGCFAPGGAQGEAVIPISWKCPHFSEEKDPITNKTIKRCDLQQNNTDDFQCTLGDDPDGTDDLIYVFFDEDTSKKYYWCSQWGDTPASTEVTPIVINCDLEKDDDPDADIYPLDPLNPSSKWYWVNTDGGACGASELNTIVEFGLSEPMYSHTWYPGCGGDKASVYDRIHDFRQGEQVIIPVFDDECRTEDPQALIPDCKWHTAIPDKKEMPSGSSGQMDFFHLSSFAAYKITCVDEGGSKCDDKKPSTITYGREALIALNDKNADFKTSINSRKSIEGCFIQGFISGLIGDVDGVATGAWTIYLTK